MSSIENEPPKSSSDESNVISIFDYLDKQFGEKPCFVPDDWKPVGWDSPPDHITKQTLSSETRASLHDLTKCPDIAHLKDWA
jgi:hypothetical protein